MSNPIQVDVPTRIGLAGLWIFALLAFVSPAGVSAGGTLMVLGLVLRRRDWLALARPSVFFSLAFAAYALARGWAAMNAYPMHGDDIAKYTHGWAWLALWFVPAFWVSRVPGQDRVVLLLALAGLLAGSFVSLHEHGSTLLTAGRDDFRIRPISLGLFSGFFLLAIWTHVPALWRRWQPTAAWLRWLTGVAVVLCSAILLQIVVLGRSRGVWLAIAAAGVLLAVWAWRHYAPRVSARARAGVAAAVIGCVAVVAAVNSDVILRKLTFEKEAASVVMSAGLDAAPVTSMTHRLALWAYALETLPRHPLFGVGPAVGEYLTADAPDPKLHNPDHDNEPFEHFHNLYVQAAMDLGLVGLGLFAAIVGSAFADALRHAGPGGGDPARLAFVVTALVMTAVWSLFDFRAVHWDWRGYFFLLMSLLFHAGVPGRAEDG